MKNVRNFLFSRLFHGRTLFFLISIFLLAFLFVNFLLFYWADANDKNLKEKLKNDNELNQQIELLKKRMDQLQDSLVISEREANKLKDRIREASKNANIPRQDMLSDSIQPMTMARDRSKLMEKLHQIETSKTNEPRIAVLVIACRRPQAIENHLRQLIDIRKRSRKIDNFPIIVSQDCDDSKTEESIRKFSSHLYKYIKQPDQSPITSANGVNIPSHLQGYYKISRHYKWAMEQVFMNNAFESAIITEEDLNLSNDFFDYFYAMYKLLVRDEENLYCVSAWNDNGKETVISLNQPELVHRSDFFPGLGWMMRRSLWLEMRDKWPKAYWDDWIREEDQRKGRTCLRPEISRTEISGAFGKFGVSLGQFYDTYLKYIVLNSEQVDWSKVNTSYLLRETYDAEFQKKVYEKSIEITFDDYLSKYNNAAQHDTSKPLLLTYRDKTDFKHIAKQFSIMDDFKCGVPRTAYKGVVRIEVKSQEIFIAPVEKTQWQGYKCN